MDRLNGKIIRFDGYFAVIETDSKEPHLKFMNLRRGFDMPSSMEVGEEVTLSYITTRYTGLWKAQRKGA